MRAFISTTTRVLANEILYAEYLPEVTAASYDELMQADAEFGLYVQVHKGYIGCLSRDDDVATSVTN